MNKNTILTEEDRKFSSDIMNNTDYSDPSQMLASRKVLLILSSILEDEEEASELLTNACIEYFAAAFPDW